MPLRRPGMKSGGKVGDKMADGGPVGGGPIKQGGDGTRQYGEGPKYPVLHVGAGSGLGRLQKKNKV